MKLNHLHLHVKNLEVSKNFYKKYFGFRDHVQYGPIHFLRDDNDLDLAIKQDGESYQFPAWYHFGFRVGSKKEVVAVFDKLHEDGMTGANQLEEEDGASWFFCTDPDGYKFEVYCD